MRSTSFVFLSVLLHVAIVLAIALSPTHIINDHVGENIEVNMSAEAEKAGAPDAPASAEPSKPQEIAKPAAVAKQAPVPKAKPTAPKATVPVAAATMSEESVEAEVTKESEPEMIPVKETAPEGIEAAKEEPVVAKVSAPPEKTPAPPAPITEPAATTTESATSTASATATESPAPPAAAQASSTAPIGVVTTATGTSSKEQETGELAKGGDSKEGAVAVADLKQLAGNKPPRYPMRARLEGRQGETELVYRVTADGKVADLSIDKSSGSKDLDAEAVKAISNYRFVPGQEGWARHPVAFSLKGIATSTPTRLRTKSGAQANVD